MGALLTTTTQLARVEPNRTLVTVADVACGAGQLFLGSRRQPLLRTLLTLFTAVAAVGDVVVQAAAKASSGQSHKHLPGIVSHSRRQRLVLADTMPVYE